MVDWIATKPEFRRRGLTNRLLLEALEIGTTPPSPLVTIPYELLLGTRG
jgi:predicted acetyltransferase